MKLTDMHNGILLLNKNAVFLLLITIEILNKLNRFLGGRYM